MHGQNIQTAQLSVPSFSLRFSSGKFIGQLFFIFLAFFLAPRKCGTNLRELVHTNDTNVYRIRPNNYLHKVARKPSNSWGATVADPEGRGKFTLLKWKRVVFFVKFLGVWAKRSWRFWEFSNFFSQNSALDPPLRRIKNFNWPLSFHRSHLSLTKNLGTKISFRITRVTKA